MTKLLKLVFILIFLASYKASADEFIRVVAEFKSTPGIKAILSIKSISGVRSIKLFDNFNSNYFKRVYQIELDERSLSQVASSSLIRKVERVYNVGEASSIDSPPANTKYIRNQWALKNTGANFYDQIDDINAPPTPGLKGFDIGIKNILSDPNLMGRDVIVAVLDYGIGADYARRIEFKGKLYKNLKECNKLGNIRGGNAKDRDKNGYAGDCLGFNFTRCKKRKCHTPFDKDGHGTHVAGIIASSMDEESGVSGIAPRAKILSVKVIKKDPETEDTLAMTDGIAKGILYSIKMKAEVINLSLGWPRAFETKYLKEAINSAIEAGIIFVAAAGNNSSNRQVYPCAYKSVICVGASEPNGKFAPYSNFGGHVDMAASGTRILSTVPTRYVDSLFFANVGFDYKDGTSQAAPFVAGTVAILKSRMKDISLNEIKARLFGSARDLVEGKHTSYGQLQVESALNLKKKVVIGPSFKNLQTIAIGNLSKRFKFNLPIENLWMEAKDIRVDVSLENSVIRLDRGSYFIDKIGEGETVDLELAGAILDLNGDSDTLIKVTVYLNDSVYREFNHLISFVRNAMDEEATIISIPKRIKESDLFEFISGKKKRKIKTINGKFRSFKYPEYYYSTKSESGFKLTVLKVEGVEFKSSEVKLKYTEQIYSMNKLDLNYDGKDDYLIRSYAKKGDNEFLLYTYLDSSLKPLFKKSLFKYLPTMPAYINVVKANFSPRDYEGGKIAIPIFTAQAWIPMDSKHKNTFDVEDDVSFPHIYYFGFGKIDGDITEFNLKIFDDHKFLERMEGGILYLMNKTPRKDQLPAFVKQGEKLYSYQLNNGTVEKKSLRKFNFKESKLGELDEYFSENALRYLTKDQVDYIFFKGGHIHNMVMYPSAVAILGMLSQSEKDFNEGKSYFNISTGKGVDRKYYLVEVKSDFSLKLTQADFKGHLLDGGYKIPVTKLDGKNATYNYSTAFTTILDDTKAQYISIDKNFNLDVFTTYRHPIIKDYLQGAMASYVKNGLLYSFYQSRDRVILKITGPGVDKVFYHPIHRVSFLNGASFNERYYSVVAGRGEDAMPAYYVNATQLHFQHVYAIVATNEGIISPIKNNVHIPKNCIPMNPILFGESESFSLFCKSERGYDMRYIPIK